MIQYLDEAVMWSVGEQIGAFADGTCIMVEFRCFFHVVCGIAVNQKPEGVFAVSKKLNIQ